MLFKKLWVASFTTSWVVSSGPLPNNYKEPMLPEEQMLSEDQHVGELPHPFLKRQAQPLRNETRSSDEPARSQESHAVSSVVVSTPQQGPVVTSSLRQSVSLAVTTPIQSSSQGLPSELNKPIGSASSNVLSSIAVISSQAPPSSTIISRSLPQDASSQPSSAAVSSRLATPERSESQSLVGSSSASPTSAQTPTPNSTPANTPTQAVPSSVSSQISAPLPPSSALESSRSVPTPPTTIPKSETESVTPPPSSAVLPSAPVPSVSSSQIVPSIGGPSSSLSNPTSSERSAQPSLAPSLSVGSSLVSTPAAAISTPSAASQSPVSTPAQESTAQISATGTWLLSFPSASLSPSLVPAPTTTGYATNTLTFTPSVQTPASSSLISASQSNDGILSTTQLPSSLMPTSQLGSSILSATPTPSGLVSVSESGSGVVSTTPTPSGLVSTSQLGSSIMSAMSSISGFISASESGSGSMSATPTLSGLISASESGSGILSATTSASGFISASTSGSSMLGTTSMSASLISTSESISGMSSATPISSSIISTSYTGSIIPSTTSMPSFSLLPSLTLSSDSLASIPTVSTSGLLVSNSIHFSNSSSVTGTMSSMVPEKSQTSQSLLHVSASREPMSSEIIINKTPLQTPKVSVGDSAISADSNGTLPVKTNLATPEFSTASDGSIVGGPSATAKLPPGTLPSGTIRVNPSVSASPSTTASSPPPAAPLNRVQTAGVVIAGTTGLLVALVAAVYMVRRYHTKRSSRRDSVTSTYPKEAYLYDPPVGGNGRNSNHADTSMSGAAGGMPFNEKTPRAPQNSPENGQRQSFEGRPTRYSDPGNPFRDPVERSQPGNSTHSPIDAAAAMAAVIKGYRPTPQKSPTITEFSDGDIACPSPALRPATNNAVPLKRSSILAEAALMSGNSNTTALRADTLAPYDTYSNRSHSHLRETVSTDPFRDPFEHDLLLQVDTRTETPESVTVFAPPKATTTTGSARSPAPRDPFRDSWSSSRPGSRQSDNRPVSPNATIVASDSSTFTASPQKQANGRSSPLPPPEGAVHRGWDDIKRFSNDKVVPPPSGLSPPLHYQSSFPIIKQKSSPQLKTSSSAEAILTSTPRPPFAPKIPFMSHKSPYGQYDDGNGKADSSFSASVLSLSSLLGKKKNDDLEFSCAGVDKDSSSLERPRT